MGWSICPAPRCLKPVPQNRAFCGDCWAMLPRKMQRRIADLWGSKELANELRRAVEIAGKKIRRERAKA